LTTLVTENNELEEISKFLDNEMKQVKVQMRTQNNQMKAKLEKLKKEVEKSKTEQINSFGLLKEMVQSQPKS